MHKEGNCNTINEHGDKCNGVEHTWAPWSEPWSVTMRVWGPHVPPEGAPDIRKRQHRKCLICNLYEEREVKIE